MNAPQYGKPIVKNQMRTEHSKSGRARTINKVTRILPGDLTYEDEFKKQEKFFNQKKTIYA